MSRLMLVSGSANKELAKSISNILDVKLTDPQIVRFANGEICCEISDTVRGADVFIIQSISHPVNDNLMEILIMLDALKRASAGSVTVVMPHYGYSRQDRKNTPRTPITAKLVADLLTVAGATRVVTMELHAGQIQGFFNIPFDNIYASPVIFEYIEKHLKSDSIMCISPDSGGVERVRHYAKKLGCELGMIDKRRPAKNIAQVMHVIGNVKDKECIIIDDIVDTAGTLVEVISSLKREGAKKIYACITHPVLSPPALERIKNCQALDKLVVTDSIPLSKEAATLEKIHVLPLAKVLAQAIDRIYKEETISPLFIESE